MSQGFDVIVAGLGAMGSAAVYQLARQGKRVMGLDRFTPPHNQGSSHGKTRIIRQAYLEGEAYVPLLLRAYQLWRQLERNSKRPLLTITGGLMLGLPDSRAVRGSTHSAQTHNIDHELLDAVAIQKRFPALSPPPSFVGLFEKQAGYLLPEVAIHAHLQLAARHGAQLHFHEPLTSWQVTTGGDRVSVTTAQAQYEAECLVLAGGAWNSELLQIPTLPLQVERVVQHWFRPAGHAGRFAAGKLPVYIWEMEDDTLIYGFPAQDDPTDGVKVAFHNVRSATTPPQLDRRVLPADVETLRTYLARNMPDLNGQHLNGLVCMYTTTPDEDFVLGLHPQYQNVAVAAGFSGHGFKFASAVGEVLADLVQRGKSRFDLTRFAPTRFTTST